MQNFADLDDHFKYTVKDLSIKVMLNQDHKILQSYSIMLLVKSFSYLHSDVTAQLTFLSDLIEDCYEKLNSLQVE